jgi:outer membrane protein TolC
VANVAAAGSRNQLGDFYNTDTSFLISQPLLRGFGAGVAQREVRRASAQVDEQIRQTTLSERRLTVEVAAAYYRLVGQSLLVDVASKSLESSRSLLEASTAKLEAGRVSQLDVSRAHQLAAEAEGQLLDARGNLEDAKDLLRGLLDLDLDHHFEVSRDIPRHIEPLTIEEAVPLALRNRPEMESAREALAEAERSVSYGRNQLLPQFDVKVGLTRQVTAETFSDSFGLDNYHLTTFFAASVPVDRTPEQTEYHNYLIDRDRRQRAISATERWIAEEARRAVRRQERLFRSLQVAESRLQFAEQELEVATLRFQRGLANNLDVVNAEENVLSARSQQIAILAELAVARLDLRAAVGVLDPREVIDASGAPPVGFQEITHGSRH